MMEHCENIGRSAHWVNMDPAAETFEGSDFYAPSVDIRDLVSVDDVMTELQYGPNGALIFALEYGVFAAGRGCHFALFVGTY